MLDVRRMRVLRSVVTSGSITAAAANLGYTPSAISQQIATLEREAGMPLLTKAGRGIQPTEAGKLLAERAADLMDRLTETENALSDLRAGRSGRLRLNYFATAGAALLPSAVASFRAKHPKVRLELRLFEPAYLTEGFDSEGADVRLVVLRQSDSGQQVPGMRLVHLLDDPYRVVLPRGHRLAGQPVVELADLAEEPWVDNEWPPGMCRMIMLDAFAAAGFAPHFVVESDDYPTAQGFVAVGLGVTLVPQLALGATHPGVVVRRVRLPEPVRSIYAAVPDSLWPVTVVQDMVGALAAAASKL